MNHSTDQNKKDYGRLIEALTPKHAPVTRMKFVMPRHRRNRLARFAASCGTCGGGVGDRRRYRIASFASRHYRGRRKDHGARYRETAFIQVVSHRIAGKDAPIHTHQAVQAVARRRDDPCGDELLFGFGECRHNIGLGCTRSTALHQNIARRRGLFRWS